MEQKYICHKCKERFNLDYDDVCCPFCGTEIAHNYSDSYLEAESEYIKNHKIYQLLENKNKELKDSYKYRIILIEKLYDDINKFSADINEFAENSELDIEELEELCIENANLSNTLNKYKAIFGDEYVSEKYICYQCKERFNLDYDSMHCPYCDAEIFPTYSDSYLEAESELAKKDKEYKKLTNKNKELKNRYKNQIILFDELSDNINKFSAEINKSVKVNKLDREKLEEMCIENTNLSNIFDKYKTIFGDEYIRDKKYYVPNSKSERYGYMEYINLGSDKRAEYDGLEGFEFISFGFVNNGYLEITDGSREHSYIVKTEDNRIIAFPGESVSNNDYDDMYEYYNLIFDIEIEECEKLSKKQSDNNIIIPAELKKEDCYYKIIKKGKIIHKIERVDYEYNEDWE